MIFVALERTLVCFSIIPWRLFQILFFASVYDQCNIAAREASQATTTEASPDRNDDNQNVDSHNVKNGTVRSGEMAMMGCEVASPFCILPSSLQFLPSPFRFRHHSAARRSAISHYTVATLD